MLLEILNKVYFLYNNLKETKFPNKKQQHVKKKPSLLKEMV
jgi:hypothetical protein